MSKTALRLRELRKENQLSQEDLADLLGVSATAYGYYERGRTIPPADVVTTLAKKYEVSTDYLLGVSNISKNTAQYKGNNKILTVPVLGNIPAGVPIEAIENIEDYEEIVVNATDVRDYFALKVDGNSMAPRILNGDVVICRKQEIIENNTIGVVIINGNDATLKRVKRSANGITLIPDNPAYDPKYYTAEEVENLPIRIIGEMVELRGKY